MFLLSGKARAQHPDHMPDLNFKKAKREVKKGGLKGLFGGDFHPIERLSQTTCKTEFS